MDTEAELSACAQWSASCLKGMRGDKVVRFAHLSGVTLAEYVISQSETPGALGHSGALVRCATTTNLVFLDCGPARCGEPKFPDATEQGEAACQQHGKGG